MMMSEPDETPASDMPARLSDPDPSSPMQSVVVMISTNGGVTSELVQPGQHQLDQVRYSFNPSGRPRVAKLKALAAAFIYEAERAGAETGAGREAAVAITNMQTASMWAVLAATHGAP